MTTIDTTIPVRITRDAFWELQETMTYYGDAAAYDDGVRLVITQALATARTATPDATSWTIDTGFMFKLRAFIPADDPTYIEVDLLP